MKSAAKLGILVAVLILTGCATSLKDQQYDDQISSDPYAKINRSVYAFNDALDKAILKPAATAYDSGLPSFFQTGVENFISNLGEPISFVNNLLQLKIDDSLSTVARFAFNSTLGIGGIIDISTGLGIEEQEEDFGQTLAYWGVKPGPYLYLPFLGPSNLRDAISMVPDFAVINSDSIEVVSDTALNTSTVVIDAINTRAQLLPLDKLIEQQIDPYSFIKSAYEQNRISEIYDGNPPDPDDF